MYYEIYIDQFFMEQLLTGYILLWLCLRLQKRTLSWGRLAAGSIGNAVWATGCILHGALKAAALGIFAAGLAVFPKKTVKQFGKDLFMLLFVTICFSGTLELLLELCSVPIAAGGAAAGAAVRYGWKLYETKKPGAGRLLEVHLYWQDQKEELWAIWDTGNQLTEPLTGQPVSIMEKQVADRLLGEHWQERRGFYMIPYHSLGTNKGWMQGVAIDAMEVVQNGTSFTIKKPVLAIYEGQVSSTRQYQVILHPKHSGES